MRSSANDYDSFYHEFDAPWMQQLRRDAYGEDIGQHSWVTADELRADVVRLGVSTSSRLVDLGCGPGGPLTFILASVRCRGIGVDSSSEALRVAKAQARALGVDALFEGRPADLNEPLPFESRAFDAVMALDVVLHLRDRAAFFREVARVLAHGGRFLFTDAGVVTGAITDDDVRARSGYGAVQLVSPGSNERLIELAGFRLIETEDRTASVIRNAGGRLAAIDTYLGDLERVWGAAEVERQRRYLETVVTLAQRRTLSRFAYVCGNEGRREEGRGVPM